MKNIFNHSLGFLFTFDLIEKKRYLTYLITAPITFDDHHCVSCSNEFCEAKLRHVSRTKQNETLCSTSHDVFSQFQQDQGRFYLG